MKIQARNFMRLSWKRLFFPLWISVIFLSVVEEGEKGCSLGGWVVMHTVTFWCAQRADLVSWCVSGVREVFALVLSDFRVSFTRVPVETGLHSCTWLTPHMHSFFSQVEQDALDSVPVFTRYGLRSDLALLVCLSVFVCDCVNTRLNVCDLLCFPNKLGFWICWLITVLKRCLFAMLVMVVVGE